MDVRREEYLDHMTFKANKRPLFTETFGPIIGLKEEWAAQGATQAELDMSAFRYRQAMSGSLPVNTFSCVPKRSTAAQPPGPGLGSHAPSV